MTAYSMETDKALAIVADIASRWGENFEENFSRRLEVSDSDEECAKVAADSMMETEEAIELRDLWRALETVQAIMAQKGCEHFGSDCPDGKLTTLIDTVVFG